MREPGQWQSSVRLRAKMALRAASVLATWVGYWQ